MTMLLTFGVPVLIFFVMIIVLGFIIARLYKRTTPDRTMIRTGAGGEKVIQNGGALIIPMMHEVTWVNMKTLGLEVSRTGTDALITADRMRVDVGTKFFIRVKPDAEGIAQAAKTLGSSTADSEALRKLVEDKLVDALRSVAALMTMDELHEKRSIFVQKVQEAVNSDLVQNGLELESVSLTSLDQTPFDKMDKNNAFNAIGMQKLAQIVADSQKNQAQIASQARVAVAETEQTAALRELEIKQTTQSATIAQEQAVTTAKADSEAAIAIALSEATRKQQEARIGQEQALEIAEQDRKIAVNEKSMAESQARAKADLARAEAIQAEESVKTASQVAVADRSKKIAIIQAEQDAEKGATATRVAAATERAAAEDMAAAVLTRAQAEADAVLIQAKANADAKKAEAAGSLAVSLAEAEGKTAMVNAENSLTAEIIEMKLQLARLEALPGIIAEMVAPAQNIDRITLTNVTGMGNVGGSGSGEGTGNGGAAGQVADAILSMGLNLPIVQALGKQAGVNLGEGLTGVLDDLGGSVALTDPFDRAVDAADAAFLNQHAKRKASTPPTQAPKA
jgi:flotillin